MTTHFATVPVDWAPREAPLRDREPYRPLALVVNDDPMIATTVSAILNGNGLAALATTKAQSALETARLIPPEILIADLTLPGMGGFTLALEITQMVPDCEVILVCDQAFTPTVAESMCRIAHAFTIMVKPIHPADLLDGIRLLLARRGHPFSRHKPFRNHSLDDVLFGAQAEGVSAPDPWVRARRRIRPGTHLV